MRAAKESKGQYYSSKIGNVKVYDLLVMGCVEERRKKKCLFATKVLASTKREHPEKNRIIPVKTRI